MKLAILSNSTTANGATLLKNAANKQNIECDIFTIDVARKIADYKPDVCIVRIAPSTYEAITKVVVALEASGITMLPSYDSILSSFDKYTAYQVLSHHGISTPASFVDVNEFKKNLPLAKSVIIKPRIGNRGIGVRKVALEFADLRKGEIVQEYFIKGNNDKRLFVINGKVVAAMQRFSSDGSDLANLAQGGRAVSYKPTFIEEQIVAQASSVMGLYFAGIDIIEDDNDQPVILEANPSPGFKISKITGVDVEGMLITSLIETGVLNG